jgi:hypothetical protein
MLNQLAVHRAPTVYDLDDHAGRLLLDADHEERLPLTAAQMSEVIDACTDFAFDVAKFARELDRLRLEAWSHDGDLIRHAALDDAMALLGSIAVPAVDVDRMAHHNWIDQQDADWLADADEDDPA